MCGVMTTVCLNTNIGLHMHGGQFELSCGPLIYVRQIPLRDDLQPDREGLLHQPRVKLR